jgi:hypothetical protein
VKRLPGERVRRRNHATGVTVVLVDTASPGRPLVAEPWATICLEHEVVMGHLSRALGVAWMAEPWAWCQDCQTQELASGTTHAVHLGGVKDRKGRRDMEHRKGRIV